MFRTPMRKTVSAIAFAMTIMFVHHVDAQPTYEIFAVSLPGQSFSNVEGISSNGQFAIGTSGENAIAWTPGGGTIMLATIPGGGDFQIPQSVNNSGIGAGFAATTSFGSSPTPGTWDIGAGTASALPLVPGQSIGRAFAINNFGSIVGSNAGGLAARYSAGGSSIITETFPDGGILTSAFGINDAGRVVGSGLDPADAAITRGFYLDPAAPNVGAPTAIDIGALFGLGHNSAIAFDVAGDFIAGSSSFNSGVDGRAFIWEDGVGMTEITLLSGTTGGSARGVNEDGWSVGVMSSATSIAFLNDGTMTYSIEDLLSNPTGWDLTTGTSNVALGISNNGTIVGRGLFNGQITGFVAIRSAAIPEPGSACLLGLGAVVLGSVRRRRRI